MTPQATQQRETVIVFAKDHHQAKAAWVEYCNEKGDDGVSRVCRYISDEYQLRGYRRKPEDPRQVVLLVDGWSMAGGRARRAIPTSAR